MNRPFRPRPLDIHRKLPIVKSVKDLDIDDGAPVTRNLNAVGFSEIEQTQPTPTKRKASEIPTPKYVIVDSYESDYQQTFVQPSSYVRGRGSRNDTTGFVEYDLDIDDDDWLYLFNKAGTLLSHESFEWMLYKLELLDHKVRERAGAVPVVYGAPIPVFLQLESALEMLQSQTSEEAIIAAVFGYWKAKREQWQKPILRRLQPPPPVNDTNPFNVFRPREKINKSHARKAQRRENDVASFEKLRQVRCNLEQARLLLEVLQTREERKRDLLDSEVNLQTMRITSKHDSGLEDELVMSEGKWAPFSLMLDQGDNVKCTWRRRRAHFQSRGRSFKRIATVDSFEPVLLFVKPVDSDKLSAAGIVPPLSHSVSNGTNDKCMSRYQYQGRIGRGGRLIFDRWNPLARMAIGFDSISSLSDATSRKTYTSPPRLSSEKETV